MPFCTNCGSRIDLDARFCVGCGKSLGNAAAAAPAPAPEPLDYTIQGEGAQVVRIRLKPGQEVFAETGRMVYKFPEVRSESRAAGTMHFAAESPSEVGFAGGYPGRIQALDLKAGQSVLIGRDALVCAQATARLELAPVKRLTGPGTVFIQAGGDFIEFVLNPGQAIQVDGGSIVAFDESVGHAIEAEAGVTTLTGPGRVLLQSVAAKSL
jgi:uncharacterized protein (AIM24 family)